MQGTGLPRFGRKVTISPRVNYGMYFDGAVGSSD